MRFDVLSLFPEIINAYSQESIIKNAIEADLIDLNLCNPRDYSLDKHKKVDDTPYGGGAGMLLQIQPYLDCFLETIRQSNTALKDFRIDDFYPEANDRLGFMYPQEREYEVIMFSPRGERFNQEIAQELSTKKHLVMLCGRYEGFDERLRNIVSKEISIGDFVLTGGELPALTVIDAVARLLPSVLGDSHSAVAESFNSALDIFDMDCKTAISSMHSKKFPCLILSIVVREIGGMVNLKNRAFFVPYG